MIDFQSPLDDAADAEDLVALRQRSGLSLEEFARRMNVPPAEWLRYESGVSYFPQTLYERAVTAFS